MKSAFGRFGYEIRRMPCQDGSELSDDFGAQQVLIGQGQAVTIFDIGAHHGHVTAKYRRLFPGAAIYCFEPFVQSIEVLQKRFGGDRMVEVVGMAVADRQQRQPFFVSDYESTSSLLPRPISARRYYPKKAATKSQVEVKVTTIDAFMHEKQVDRIDILKLDIQGAELPAVRGAETALREQRIGLIFTEVAFVPHYEGGTRYHELAGFLEPFGFSLFNLYDLKVAGNGQLRYGDALFVSEKIRREVLDRMGEEP